MENTKISWCDHTFNAWIGCMKVNEACKYCYAEALDNRFSKERHWGAGSNRQMMTKKYWHQPVIWNKNAERAGIKLRVFTSSLADVFENHPQVVEPRKQLFELIENTPNLIWMVLTKRPENIYKFIPTTWQYGGAVPPNVRFGVSIGNQKHFDEMWPVMEEAMYNLHASYFLSVEPLLGRIDMSQFNESIMDGPSRGRSRLLPSYIIVGGESGSQARPMHVDWVTQIQKSCIQHNIKFHFKQWGEWQLGSEHLSKHNMIVFNNGEIYEQNESGMKAIKKKYSVNELRLCNPHVMCKVGKMRSGDMLHGEQYKDLID